MSCAASGVRRLGPRRCGRSAESADGDSKKTVPTLRGAATGRLTMTPITRRNSMAGLLGLGGAAALPCGLRAAAPVVVPGADIPPQGIGNKIRHVGYSDQGGRPDGVQVMMNRKHLYVGHMFSDGMTTLDASDPRNLKRVNFFTAGVNTRTHHLQVANDLLLLANGANIVSMQSYDTGRGYFENTLADSITKKVPFRSGLSIHDISKPTEPKEIAFLQNPTKPEIVSKWWMPGMNRAAGEVDPMPKGKRMALHHMIVAGDRGYSAWRDGGLTIHDISDATHPKLLSHINWSPPFAGGTHTPLPLQGRKLSVVCEESNAEFCEKGLFYTWMVDVREDANPLPISSFPTPPDRDFCKMGNFGPHNLHENRPGTFQSEETIFSTYHDAGVRVFDIRDAHAPREIASWVPPVPSKMIDPRPNVARGPLACDCYVTAEGLM